MSAWEYVAVLLGLSYVILVMKESLWCWPAAFISTLIYTILFWQGALLMESFLSFYYLLMAIYGWYCWRNGPNKAIDAYEALPIQSWTWQRHSQMISITLVLSMITGFIMDNFTNADFAYLDSLTSCFSVLSTYLVARKVLENWLYWVVIDLVSIYLYINKGFYPTTILFVFYTVMSIWGYLHWRQSLTNNQAIPITQ